MTTVYMDRLTQLQRTLIGIEAARVLLAVQFINEGKNEHALQLLKITAERLRDWEVS